MSFGNDFDELQQLDERVLEEVVREGEARIDAQLSIATAADQRALTFAGFQIAAATGALAGGVALMGAETPDLVLALVAILFSLAMLSGAGFAIATVWPREFSIPGNQPVHWVPSSWRWPDRGNDIKAARVEQASCLQEMIEKNALFAEWCALRMHWSMGISLASVGLAGVTLLGVLLCRSV